MRVYLRASGIIATLLGLGFLFPAVGLGQPTKVEQPKGTVVTPPQKPQLKVKVFKLERADPEAVLLGLNNLLDEPDIEMPGPMLPGAGGPMPPAGGMLGALGAPGGIGGLGVTGGPVGGMAGGFAGSGALGFGGGFAGGGGGTLAPAWRATVDARTNAVIVRGSEKHLKVAADLVAILDRRANAPLPKLEIVKAYALKHAEAATLVQVIDALAFEDIRLSSPEEKLLAVIGPDEATKAIAEIVKELDVPAKTPEETKKETDLKKIP